MKENNIYYRARMQAVERDRLFASRERVADLIYVSAEALYDYESGKTTPPCDAVCKMVEAYGNPDLRAAHIRACCPLLPDYGEAAPSELTRAALSWAVAFDSAQQVALRFAQVARDGRVSPEELPAAMVIREKAVELRRVMEDTIAALDKAVAQTRGG